MTWPARQSRAYHEQRMALIEFLGGRCALALTEPEHCCVGPLHVHHLNGREWSMRDTSSHCRVKLLWQEARAGKLGLLCARANSQDGQRYKRKCERERGCKHKAGAGARQAGEPTNG